MYEESQHKNQYLASVDIQIIWGTYTFNYNRSFTEPITWYMWVVLHGQPF